MAGPGAFITSDSMQQTAPKLEQQPSLVGNTWGQKSNALDVLRANPQSSNLDCLPPDPFGDIEGQLLALKTDDKQRWKPDYSNSPNVWYHQAVQTCQEKYSKCENLVKDGKKSPYAETTGPHVPKCNWFLNDVFKASGIPVPWDSNHPPDVHGMNQALAKDPRYETVWSRSSNEKDWGADARRFLTTFKPQDSDILIWDNRHLQHTGIAEETLDGHGNTFYAGRDTESGLGHSDLPVWWVSSRVKGYGAPDAIYRYKNLSR
jgi:hypothetical protein